MMNHVSLIILNTMLIKRFKFYYIIVTIISILLFNISYHQEIQKELNILENTYYFNDSSYNFGSIDISHVTNKQLESFHNELMSFYENKDVVVRISYFDYVDEQKIWNVFMYDPSNAFMNEVTNNMACEGVVPDLSKMDETRVLSTNKDSIADAYAQLLNLNYFNKNGREIRISGLSTAFDNFHVVSNLTGYFIWYKDTMYAQEINAIAAKYFSEYNYFISEDLENNSYEEDFFNVIPLFILYCLFLGLSLFYILYHKYKQIVIETLIGYKPIEILIDCFKQELTNTILCLLVPLVILYSIFVSRIDQYTMRLIFEQLKYVMIILLILMIICMLFVYYLNKNSVYHSIASKQKKTGILLYIGLIKLFYVMFISIFIVFTVVSHLDYYYLLSKYYEEKEVIDSFYKVDSGDGALARDYVSVLKDEGMVICEFNNNSFMDEQDDYYSIPFIVVNNEYMKTYNKPYCYDKTTFIIPQKYKNVDLYPYVMRYVEDDEYDIEFVNHTEKFKQISIANYQEEIDPIVLVNNSGYGINQSNLYFKNNHSITYYKNIVENKIGENKIELTSNGKYAKEFINEKILPVTLNDMLYLLIYLGTFVFLIVFNMCMYLQVNEKEIVLKTIHGYKYMQIFKRYHFLNILPYIFVILVFRMFKNIDVGSVLILVLGLIDFLISFVVVKTSKRNIDVIKEV